MAAIRPSSLRARHVTIYGSHHTHPDNMESSGKKEQKFSSETMEGHDGQNLLRELLEM